MAKKTTINDIAKSLGLSRNTISRALNGSEGIADETRVRILEEPARLNYKMFGARKDMPAENKKMNIMLVTKDVNLMTSRMLNFLMFILQPTVRERNAMMTMQFLTEEEILHCRLPAQIGEADALIVFEILNENCIQRLLDYGKPAVLFDSTVNPGIYTGSFDVVTGNPDEIIVCIRELAAKGKKKFGFVGDCCHCFGFQGRYNAFRIAVEDYCGTPHGPYDIIDTETSQSDFTDLYRKRLAGMELPDAFICANYYLAQKLENAAAELGIRPGDVEIYGFGMGSYSDRWLDEDSGSYKEMKDMTVAIMMLLMDRLQYPDSRYRVVYTHGCITQTIKE